MSQSTSNPSMSKSTAEALKLIQKQGLSISIINPDSSKTIPLEAATKDTRAKQNAVTTEKIIIPTRTTVSTEGKASVSQTRQPTSVVETRAYNVQPAISTNQTVQSGNNKPNSQVSESKIPNSQRLGNSNTVENKNQSFLNRISQIEKGQTVAGRVSQNSVTEHKLQTNRNIPNSSGLTETKTPLRVNQTDSKSQITRSQNQTSVNEGKTLSNQSRITIGSPPLEGKVLQGRLSQNSSTSVIDKNTNGQRNQLQTSQTKAPNSQCKITPIRQAEMRTCNASKQQNVKIISTPRGISQFHPPASQASNILNNGKVVVDKSSVTPDRSMNNPFRVASTLTKNSDEKSVLKVTKMTENVDVSGNQLIKSKVAQHISLKTENKAVSQVIKISEVTSNVQQKSLSLDNSPELNPQRLITMPMQKTAVKRIAVSSSTPNSAAKKKCIKIISPNTSDQSGSQSDVNTLSSDESPVKEKKVFNLKTLTSGLTITPVHPAASNPSTSGSKKKVSEPNQTIFVKCPTCKQPSFNLSSCDNCHAKLNANTLYTLTNAQPDAASIVVTQNVTTSIENRMQILYVPGASGHSIQLQQSHQVIKVSPKKGRPRRKLIEPVCYTLSSDDEEVDQFNSMLMDGNSSNMAYPAESEGSKSEHSNTSDFLQEENQDYDDPQYPGVTSINKHQIDGEEEELLDQEMESEEELMDEEEEEIEPQEFVEEEEEEELEEEEEEEEDIDEEIPPDEDERPIINHKPQLSTSSSIVITCRSIRIGSIRLSPEPNTKAIRVNLSVNGFTFSAVTSYPFLESHKSVHLTLKASETPNAWIHFGKCLPIIFAFTSRSFGETVKKTLHVPKTNPPPFDPTSDDVKRNKVTFLIDTLTDDQRNFLRHVFPGPQRLKEIDQKEANEMLVKSTPATIQSFVKLESCNSQPVNTCTVSQPVLMIPTNLSTSSISITKVMPKPAPPVPVTKILTYPPPPQTGGIAINTADLATLEEGEFLNDAILDFYLKYVFYEKLSPRDREKTHIFSSFFYPRLTQKPDRNRAGENEPKSMQMRRHSQVRTWTKHVDIFSKDYIVIPVNQANHWFLALICYPGNVPDSPIKIEPEPSKCADNVTSTDEQEHQSRVIIKEETCDDEDTQNPDENSTSSNSFYEVEEPPDSDEASSEIPDSSTHPDGYVTCHEIKAHRKETPCILIFDSLSGPNRWRIASTLREYLEMEWKIRKGTRKVFDRNTMQGFIVKCPQQTNFSDCGLYVLQYVESFFENPIPYFANPMPDLTNWFTDGKISKKRQQLKELILNLQKKYAVKQVAPTVKKNIQPSASSGATTLQSENR